MVQMLRITLQHTSDLSHLHVCRVLQGTTEQILNVWCARCVQQVTSARERQHPPRLPIQAKTDIHVLLEATVQRDPPLHLFVLRAAMSLTFARLMPRNVFLVLLVLINIWRAKTLVFIAHPVVLPWKVPLSALALGKIEGFSRAMASVFVFLDTSL